MINTAHIAFRRIRLDMSQADLAHRTGLTADHICRIEKGKIGLSVKSLVAICRALDTTPNRVLHWNHEND